MDEASICAARRSLSQASYALAKPILLDALNDVQRSGVASRAGMCQSARRHRRVAR